MKRAPPGVVTDTVQTDSTGAQRRRLGFRIFLSLFYLTAGVFHILLPAPFIMITPDWVPWPSAVILFTGLCELAGAVGLWVPRLRKSAGIGLALYAVAVYPANIHHAFLDMALAQPQLGLAYHIPRLLAQPVLVWVTLYAVGLERWRLWFKSF
ncbi:DoxX family protein [Aestuariivirga litoralis]|uniref:DoxX family protein n=1 Tax=Aestuariivirga litoralis TaxID=2650924 RepID=UPI0018C4D879|nr:DoxX family protein [Aestuariivirga litoralis]MBG1233239.1 hypothetical protein [Aestuariivirga litoralis]